MRGIVQSGGTPSTHIGEPIVPIANAKVTVWQSNPAPVIAASPVTTDAEGRFTIDDWIPSTPGVYFVTAEVSEGVVLMALLGTQVLDFVTVNELTTVAACWSGAQFIREGLLYGEKLPLRIAAGMSANVVNVADGTSSPVLTNSPNANETTTLGVTRSLANFLASVVRSPEVFLQEFFKLAGVSESLPANSPDRNTITALGNIARSPARNVGGIFVQSQAVMIYQPPVQQQPDAWTIAVKVNDSGDDSNMFGGTGNLAFDSQGRVWITNNVNQGTPDSSPVSMVLDFAGHPARDENGQLLTPYSGGGLLGAGFGIAIDSLDRVWIGDFGWSPTTIPPGSVSLFNSSAQPLSPSAGYTAGVKCVQGITFDDDGNLWIASYGHDNVAGSVVVYPGVGKMTNIPNPPPYYSFPPTPDPDFNPFDIAIASDGTAWVTDSNPDSSGVLHLRFTGSGLTKLSETRIGRVMKGVVIDSEGSVWAASGGDDTVYRFDPAGNLLGAYQGGGTWGPWGICLDGDDNVWVGNFGPLEPGSNVHGRLTQLAGAKATGHIIGTGLTPQSGYTMPTAGDEVLLHDNTRLYGADGPKCFIPMMRTTAVAVDAAGNVWSCNNWKPDFDIDVGDPKTGKAGNPGGDGMIIWLGLAKPVS